VPGAGVTRSAAGKIKMRRAGRSTVYADLQFVHFGDYEFIFSPARSRQARGSFRLRLSYIPCQPFITLELSGA